MHEILDPIITTTAFKWTYWIGAAVTFCVSFGWMCHEDEKSQPEWYRNLHPAYQDDSGGMVFGIVSLPLAAVWPLTWLGVGICYGGRWLIRARKAACAPPPLPGPGLARKAALDAIISKRKARNHG